MTYETHTFDWQGRTIEARFCPQRFDTFAHLEVETIEPHRAALPISATGYRSHFHPVGMIDEDHEGDVIAAVRAWLDDAAQSESWIEQEQAARQGELFA